MTSSWGTGLPVGPVDGHGIEDVHDRTDARLDGNVLSRNAVWVSTPVPPFVMRKGDAFAHLENVGLRVGKDLGSEDGVVPHHRYLFRI